MGLWEQGGLWVGRPAVWEEEVKSLLLAIRRDLPQGLEVRRQTPTSHN